VESRRKRQDMKIKGGLLRKRNGGREKGREDKKVIEGVNMI
jgi:hypothetical protein